MRALHSTIFRCAWVIAVLVAEIALFLYSTTTCTWPTPSGAHEGVQHVLIIADPQIIDDRSYPERVKPLRALSQFVVDMNLRKAWMVAKRTRPDALVFLGDMMDNGRANMSGTEYRSYLKRFHSIFTTPDTLPTYYIPGNHDVGLGKMPEPDFEFAQLRYKTSFGPLNQHIHLADHSLILVDAISLAASRRQQMHAIESLPRELRELQFMRSQFAKDGNDPPAILFTHIPLYRPDGGDCGSLREKGSINAGFGWGYQNVLSPDTSKMLYDAFHPILVFSGDDHDYCAYTHPPEFHNVTEISVKSMSMAMGIQRPGFHLLSLSPNTTSSPASLAHRSCELPDQMRIYLRIYVPLLVITLAAAAYMGISGQEVVLVVHDKDKRDTSIELGRLGGEESVRDSTRGRGRERERGGTVIRWRSRGRGGAGWVMRCLGGIAWPPLLVYSAIVLVLFW